MFESLHTNHTDHHSAYTPAGGTPPAVSVRSWPIPGQHGRLRVLLLLGCLAVALLAGSLLPAGTRLAHAAPVPPGGTGYDYYCIKGRITYQATSSNKGQGTLTVLNHCGETIVLGQIQYGVGQECDGLSESFYPGGDFFYALADGASQTFHLSFFHACVICDETGIPVAWLPFEVWMVDATIAAFRQSGVGPDNGQVGNDSIQIDGAVWFANDMYEGGCGSEVSSFT